MRIKTTYFDDYVVLEECTADTFNLRDTFDCGQCFRWEKSQTQEGFTGVAYGKILNIQQFDDHVKLFCNKEDFDTLWRQYFDLDTDYEFIKEQLRSDDVMNDAIRFAPGIRILKQELFETTISFITSSNSNIKRITKNIRDLSVLLGEPLTEDVYSFPTIEAISSSDIFKINQCRAGFRCNYILQSSLMINDIKTDFNTERFKDLGYIASKKELMLLKGVGEKVADCIILFSGISPLAFPTDVWVKRIMENLYIKKEVSLDYVRKYGQEKFKDLAGYAQQYLFYYARNNNIK